MSFRAVIFSLLASAAVATGTTYVSYVGDVGGSPANPAGQGWTVTGGRARSFSDGGVLGWELNDRNNNPYPTMWADYGAGNIPQAGDPWAITVTTRVLYGNGDECNQIQWCDGTILYRIFLYEDGAGNIDVGYRDTGGNPSTLDSYLVNDDGYHDWAIVHDGFTTKVTFNGADVVAIGSEAAGGTARGVTIGGGSNNGRGKLRVSAANYDATLAPPSGTTRFAAVFADHMVLQRDTPVAIFGTDDLNPGAQNITVTFAGQSKNTTTDGTGAWRVDLDLLAASATGRDLVVTGSSTATVTDVLVGEVWLAAGQENMNFPVSASSSPPDPATYPLVRMCNWEGTVATGDGLVYGPTEFDLLAPDSFYSGTWQALDATTVQGQSAVAYFFAHDLAASLGVPVGIVDLSVDGTSTEAYIPASVQSSDFLLRLPFEKPRSSPSLGQWTTDRIATNLAGYTHGDPTAPHPHPFAPGFLYEVGLARLVPFTFKGVLWSQGESNAAFTEAGFARNGKWISDYQLHVLSTLVSSWRSALGNPSLPFYQVQLPRVDDPLRLQWPWYRDAQQRLADSVPGVETAIITEFGDDGPGLMHPDKQPVSERLARLARAHLYGQLLEPSGPVCTGQTIAGDRIVLQFDHPAGGLISSDGQPLRHFAIAGADRTFVPAAAAIVGDTVEVSAPSVPAPVAVRYAWEMNPDVNFFNDAALPAAPFRTDDWMLSDLGRPIRVACIGDSITAGYGIPDPADFYPAQLLDLLGTAHFEVRNFGLPGARVFTTSLKYENSTEFAEAVAYNPDIVISNIGLNDVNEWGQYSRDDFLAAYKSLMDAFAAPGRDPMLIIWHEIAPIFTSVAGTPNLLALIDLIGDCAGYMGVNHIDMAQPLENHPEWFDSGGIHPNATGARVIAEETYLFLRQFDRMDARLRLTEFMAINTGTLQDEDGDFSAWFEIGNTGTSAAIVDGHHLTDDLADLTRWQLPTGMLLDPDAAILVFASGKNRSIAGQELHANFLLPATGGSLALVAADGLTVLDAYDPYPSQYADRSCGIAGGSTTGQLHYFTAPSPGAANPGSGLPPYANWKDVYGVTTDSEDLDHDGLSAIVEFFSGSLPDSASSVYPPIPVLVPETGQDHFGIRFRLAKGIPGLMFDIESSELLPGASPPEGNEAETVITDTVLVSSADNGDGTCTYTYRLISPVGTMPRRFLRVKYNYSE